MSKFFSPKFKNLIPYTPGEQPKDMKYTKLNTNESPFKPHKSVSKAVKKEAASLYLYPDPECNQLTRAVADMCSVEPENVLLTNGSDEILNFAFMAFCDKNCPAAFADITYGFYSVFAEINGIPYTEIPLKDDFSINVSDYINIGKTVFIANPNAPTGIALSVEEIERIVAGNPDNVVVVDEAYVDFGAESCIPLIKKYNNLLVTQTFSKSRSMAGGRLGFGVGCKELIADLNTVKYSTNPYNINRLTMAAGLAILENDRYTRQNCKTVISNREYTKNELIKLGFELTESKANFLFAKHPKIGGEELYLSLKRAGILVRHFSKPEIADYNRITVGNKKQMEKLINAIKQILEEKL